MGRTSRKRNPIDTRTHILEAAIREFSSAGFSGARIERIAKGAKCNVRMLYHHFGNKEDLYRAVLVHCYARIRNQEADLHLAKLPPLEGMVQLLNNTFDHFANNPEFVALLNNENLMRGRFVLRLKSVAQMTSPLRRALETLIERGERQGLFRKGIDPVQIYASVAAMGWFHLSNAYTLSAMFGRDLTDPTWRRARRAHVRDVIMSYLLATQTELRATRSASQALENGAGRNKRSGGDPRRAAT